MADRYPEVPHSVELFDALLAKVIIKPDSYRVVLVLNEYGDFLSDLASGLVGSLGTGASGNFSFNADNQVEIAGRYARASTRRSPTARPRATSGAS